MTQPLKPSDFPDLFVEDANVHPVLKCAARTDRGMKRDLNQDKFEFFEPDDPEILATRGALYAVADGMGGAAAGQVASEETLNKLIEAYYRYYNTNSVDGLPIDAETALANAAMVANGRVFDIGTHAHPEWKGMGATLTCVVFVRNRAYIAQVGDSRAYLIRDEQIRQVTMDHSLLEENRRMGLSTNVPRNMLTRSVGTRPHVEVDIFLEAVRQHDIWVLCSDGLIDYMEPEEIRQVALNNCPIDAVSEMIESAKTRGGSDNITVMVVTVREMAPFGV